MIRLISFALTAILGCVSTASAATGIDAISAYAGTWKIETEHFATPYSKQGKESATLRNDCWRSADFYACHQFVNGESKALIVFTYDSKKDLYASYGIPADGGKANSGKLLIRGNVWTYPYDDEENGKITHFRVVNTFPNADEIEYRSEYSDDGATWKLMAKGHERKQH